MWISNISIQNIKGYKATGKVKLSKTLNILIGSNNSGKSTLLQSIHLLQGGSLNHTDIRKKTGLGTIEITFDGDNFTRFGITNVGRSISKEYNGTVLSPNFHIEIYENGHIARHISSYSNTYSNYNDFQATEPNNLIYPFLSKRKVGGYSETVGLQYARQVSGNLSQLTSKIDRLSDPNFPKYDEYKKACIDILGYPISASQSDGGKRVNLIVDEFTTIPIEAMGDGVPNILGMIADLCLPENQIFLIEELENDIHPKALKALLELIIVKSAKNQFFISTHSNIVTKILGSVEDAKIFNVSMEFEEGVTRIPLSTIYEIENNPEERRKVLEDLGYDFFDYELWKGWLFLEEASAESIIKDYLIPWFMPKMVGKIKTFSARTISEIELKFEDFNRLFVYLHLTSIYKNKAWVIIDQGKQESKIIQNFKNTYSKNGWNNDQFLQFSKHDFEEYYPERFEQKFSEIKKEQSSNTRQKLKAALLKEVKEWAAKDPDVAKKEFERSAMEVIEILRSINEKL